MHVLILLGFEEGVYISCQDLLSKGLRGGGGWRGALRPVSSSHKFMPQSSISLPSNIFCRTGS